MKVRLYRQEALSSNTILHLTKDEKHYLKNVLRLQDGEKVFVFNDAGEFESILHKNDLHIAKCTKEAELFNCKIHLVIANIKNTSISDAINGATQNGVFAIHPIITKHTTNHFFNTERAIKISIEACEQSGRSILPKISKLQSFEGILTQIPSGACIVFCDEAERESGETLKKAMEVCKQFKEIFIFIGPEGGFSAEERLILEGKNAIKISLGRFILRAEVASTCVCMLFNLAQ